MLKVLFGIGLGFLLFSNPEARQITADLLRAAGDAIAPAEEGKTLKDRALDAVMEKIPDEQQGPSAR